MEATGPARVQELLSALCSPDGRLLDTSEVKAIRALMADPETAAAQMAAVLDGPQAGERSKYLFTHLLAEAARLTPATSQQARRELGQALVALPHQLLVQVILAARPAAEEGWFGLVDVISDLPATELAPVVARHLRQTAGSGGHYELLRALADSDARLVALESATLDVLAGERNAEEARRALETATIELLTAQKVDGPLAVPEQVSDSSLLLAELIGRLGVPDAELASRLSSVSAVRVAMQQQQEIYEAALDGTSDGVIVFAQKGRVLISNPAAARILGLPPAELRQQPFAVIVSRVLDVSVEEAEEVAEAVLASGEPYVAEAEFKDTGHTYSVTICPVASEIAGPLALVVTFSDVTHFKEMARMKDDLISITTHELRSPLTSIRGFAEILLEDPGDPQEQREFLEAIHRQSLRLADIVNDFLDLSRLESGREVIVRQPTSIRGLIQRVLADMQPAAEERGTRLIHHVEEPLPEAELDAGKMEQLLTNLVANAIKYSPDQASVTVSAFAEGGMLVLEVADTGYGIPKPDIEHIFEKFYRAHDERTVQSRGTGLGLSLVKAIAEAHGGTIEVQSEVDVGSTFTCRVPLRAPADSEPQS
jgi:PAS domain S-box-containing protein